MKTGLFLFGCTLATLVSAQEAAPREPAQVSIQTAENKAAAPDYVLGPGDQVRIHVVNVEEIPDEPIVIGLDGMISLPYVGRVKLAGMTAGQAEIELDRVYRQYLIKPDISVSVVEFQSQPVSVLGAVRNPGVQQVQGKRTLVEMLSAAGGLAENAGSRLKVTRRVEAGDLPLPNAKTDPTGRFTVAEVSLTELFEGRNPEANIFVKPNDILSVPAADSVYVIGYVARPGEYKFTQQERMTALQAVSMAGGMDKLAQPKHARIIRSTPGSLQPEHTEVNLANVLEGKAPDIPLRAGDVLLIPNNLPKSALLRTLDVAIQMGTGVVIWGRY